MLAILSPKELQADCLTWLSVLARAEPIPVSDLPEDMQRALGAIHASQYPDDGADSAEARRERWWACRCYTRRDGGDVVYLGSWEQAAYGAPIIVGGMDDQACREELWDGLFRPFESKADSKASSGGKKAAPRSRKAVAAG